VVFSLGYTWQEALAMVFLCGVISLIITVTKVRKMIIESIPTALKSAISAGIGIFLAYVGIKNAGFLKFSINPHTYTVAGKGADMANASITASSMIVVARIERRTPPRIPLTIKIIAITRPIKPTITVGLLKATKPGVAADEAVMEALAISVFQQVLVFSLPM